MADPDTLTAVTFQRHHLAAAAAASSDLDVAFHLQLQEALTASLLHHPSSSSINPHIQITENNDANTPLSQAIAIQTLELDRFHQETQDSAHSASLVSDVYRNQHDYCFARELEAIGDNEWELYGDDVQRPMEESEALPFRLYFKGVSVRLGGRVVSAVGAAVCDQNDEMVFKIQKAVEDGETCKEVVEAKALVECLEAAVALGIRRIHVFFDYRALLNHITGKWTVKSRKVDTVIGEVLLLLSKFESCKMFLLPRCRVRFVFLLARAALDLQITKTANLNGHDNLMETCEICLEVTDPFRMFTVDGCAHRFCFACMKQHVEVKLLHGLLPGCPHEGCNIKLTVESSKNFLSPKLLEIMVNRLKEASIPATEIIYCPYPKCSALMSINEAIVPQLASSSKFAFDNSGHRICITCKGSFCINCKVPWHDKMSCFDYKRLNPHARAEDRKLQTLARENLWRQCAKCKHMIELAEGCFHMTCRCGYEFCYTCGAEWKDKKATCSCPLWDEGYILDEDREFDDDDDDDEGWDGEFFEPAYY